MQQKLGIRMCKAVCRTVKCTVFDNLSTALQVIVLPLPDWPNKIKDSPSLIAKDISETKLSVPDRRLMLK